MKKNPNEVPAKRRLAVYMQVKAALEADIKEGGRLKYESAGLCRYFRLRANTLGSENLIYNYPEIMKHNPKSHYREYYKRYMTNTGKIKRLYSVSGFWWKADNLKKRLDVVNAAIDEVKAKIEKGTE